jgi:AcrR family transcriptional regulator
LSPDVVVVEAASLVDAEGWEALSLTTLAQRLKVKPPSLYNHLSGLDELKRSLFVLAAERLREALQSSAVGRSGEEAVHALAHAYRRFLLEHPGLGEALLHSPAPDDPEAQRVSSEVVEVCLAALRGYQLERAEALHAVRALRAQVHGFAMLELKKGFGLKLSTAQSFEWMLDIFLRGLKR